MAALAACRADELVNGLVLFSPGPLEAFPLEDLRGPGVSKLIFTGTAGDREPARTAAALMRASIGQPLVVNLPTETQGTELMLGPWALHVLEHLAAFVDEQRAFAAARRPFEVAAEGS
jgi:pimeloyl-ACP methyl ester carboxylesterase